MAEVGISRLPDTSKYSIQTAIVELDYEETVQRPGQINTEITTTLLLGQTLPLSL